jgi:hypothetical protein
MVSGRWTTHLFCNAIDVSKLNAYKHYALARPDWAALHPMERGGRAAFDEQLIEEMGHNVMSWRITTKEKFSTKVSEIFLT